ncbi:MAG: aminopeptidase [Ruminococcaceae bacterium]|nr:aminopeptidase [Oscillospiraceae bacterium]
MYQKESGWKAADSALKTRIYDFAEGYKTFLDAAKTERAAVAESVRLAKAQGFVDAETKDSFKPGDKVYFVNRHKNVLLAVIGEEPVEAGIHFVIAHIDCPRVDIKQNPAYCDSGLALLKTHYYGGIKKYQWTAIPLALYGVVLTKDGKRIEVSIGDKEGDPVFCITDLLPHLATEQMQKKATEIVAGEALNILVGSLPAEDCEKDAEKEALLALLGERYGISEEDFLSAELEAVPAYNARDLGFDRGMIAAYGQDDRVCAYTGLQAIFDLENPAKTAVCVLTDKEEIGSMGNTGMRSAFFEYAIAVLLEKTTGQYHELMLKRTFRNSKCLSADVAAGFDPTYPETHDKLNATFMGRGVAITKYTGSRGKGGTSDANAEFLFDVRRCFDAEEVFWQCGEMGKVDFGGGGTIAQYVANLDMEVVDCGVPLLSMHAPMEVASKLDVYMAYRAYKAFFETFGK